MSEIFIENLITLSIVIDFAVEAVFLPLLIPFLDKLPFLTWSAKTILISKSGGALV